MPYGLYCFLFTYLYVVKLTYLWEVLDDRLVGRLALGPPWPTLLPVISIALRSRSTSLAKSPPVGTVGEDSNILKGVITHFSFKFKSLSDMYISVDILFLAGENIHFSVESITNLYFG